MELFVLKQHVLLRAGFLSVSSGVRVSDPGWGWTDFKILDIWTFCTVNDWLPLDGFRYWDICARVGLEVLRLFCPWVGLEVKI